MPRLNDRAFRILVQNIRHWTGSDPSRQVQQEIVLKRLERWRTQSGEPVDEAQILEAIVDMIPEINPAVVKAAARANRDHTWLRLITTGTVAGLALAGVIFIANLPISLIRRPVSQHAPLLLLPSYISMDYHYRRAIASVEQADQLVNRATSVDDLALGSVKVTEANRHLNQLPVWFLEPGYRSQFWWYGRYTIDDFRQAREAIGRMEATLFQETNAQSLLTNHEQALTNAKQAYEQALEPPAKTAALAQWQAALDALEQIPEATLAGKQVQRRLDAYQRDFAQVAGVAKGSARAGNLVQAAKAFAMNAAQVAQNPPHSATEWEEIAKFWQQAIDRLEDISVDDPGYAEAQTLLATYEKNLSITRIQRQTEEESVAALEKAQQLTQDWVASASSGDRARLVSNLQTIITQLRKVKQNTTAYAEAQTLLANAERKLTALNGN